MPGPIGRRTLLGAGLAAVLGAVASCGTSGGDDSSDGTLSLFGGTVPPGGPAVDLSPNQTAGRDVVMIGDSITVASTPGLEEAAQQLGVHISIHAEVGRRITVGNEPAPGTDVLEQVLGEGVPDLLVIALGTNDIGKYATEQEYADQITQLLDLVPPDAPVAWINTYLSSVPESSALFNAALISALGERGNATIGNWSNIANDEGVLSDGIHPTDDGAVRFASLVGDEIAAWLR